MQGVTVSCLPCTRSKPSEANAGVEGGGSGDNRKEAEGRCSGARGGWVVGIPREGKWVASHVPMQHGWIYSSFEMLITKQVEQGVLWIAPQDMNLFTYHFTAWSLFYISCNPEQLPQANELSVTLPGTLSITI